MAVQAARVVLVAPGGSAGTGGGGGGGLGAGGDIFIVQGGTLTISGGTLADGTATGGAGAGGAGGGQGYGSGIFLQGNQSVTFGTGQTNGQTTTINGAISDQTGSDTGNLYNSPGAGSVIIAGAGTVVLGGASNYTGGTTVQGGTLSISADNNIGSGNLALNGGTTVNVTGISTFTHAIALNGTATIEVDSGTTTDTKAITGGNVELIKTGAGTLVLNPTGGSNTYTGGTLIVAGTLELASSGAVAPGSYSFSGPGTLQVDAGALGAGNNFAGSLGTFGAGDALDIRGLAFNTANPNANTATISGGKLIVSNGTASETFNLSASHTGGIALTSDGHGGIEILNSLSDAIKAIDASATAGHNYTINLFGNETETVDPTAINLGAGETLTINGNGATIDGGAVNGVGGHRGLFVYSGNVTINNLTLANMNAVGGAGASGGGGGGAGLGGALFIANNHAGDASAVAGNVTLEQRQLHRRPRHGRCRRRGGQRRRRRRPWRRRHRAQERWKRHLCDRWRRRRRHRKQCDRRRPFQPVHRQRRHCGGRNRRRVTPTAIRAAAMGVVAPMAVLALVPMASAAAAAASVAAQAPASSSRR